MTSKKMYKVLCPMEGHNGQKWWAKCGAAFTNKDESINLHLDMLPLRPGFTLQLREYTEEDMRQSAERRARAPSHVTGRHADPTGGDFPRAPEPLISAAERAPF